MPTSSQSLILQKPNYKNIINFYKHRTQFENIPLEMPKVNLTGNLPASPQLPKSKGKNDKTYAKKALKSANLPSSAKQKASLSMEKNNTEDLVNKHSQVYPTSNDDVHSGQWEAKYSGNELPEVKTNDYWTLLNMGFSMSSFTGLQSMTPPRIRSCSVKPIVSTSSKDSSASERNSYIRHASSVPERRKPNKLSVDDFKSTLKLDVTRRKGEPKRSSKELTRTTYVTGDKENEDGFNPQVIKLEKRKVMKLPTIRMRNVLPPSFPGAVCFTLKGVNTSHEAIKAAIETQLGCRIDTLLFDPVYIHMGESDTEHKIIWVFTVKGDSLTKEVMQQGISWNGERARLRYYDDMMRDEHNAYTMFKSIQNEKSTKGLGVRRKRINSTEFMKLD